MIRIVLICVALLATFPAYAQQDTPEQPAAVDDTARRDGFSTAKVLQILTTVSEDTDPPRITQRVLLRIENGPDAGEERTIDYSLLSGRTHQLLQPGQRVVVETLETYSGNERVFIREFYRLPAILGIVAFFFVIAFILGGRTGFMSSMGLIVSIGVLTFFVVPRIIAGDDPMLICAIGSTIIATTSLFLAHGFHRRTSIALLSTLLTLALSIVMAMIAVWMASLFGTGSEESMFLQLGPLETVNLRGLLLGGIVIGTLGVLDDITTAQTAAVDELYKANPSMNRTQLQASALSIGREHTASLINTLALAYVGSSLPLFLLFSMNVTTPWWVILNGEFLAEEIVRTFIGSATLLFAVPISTSVAVALLHGRPTDHCRSHGHVHRH